TMSEPAEGRLVASGHETSAYWSLEPEDVLRRLASGPRGLSSDEARRRLELRGAAPKAAPRPLGSENYDMGLQTLTVDGRTAHDREGASVLEAAPGGRHLGTDALSPGWGLRCRHLPALRGRVRG